MESGPHHNEDAKLLLTPGAIPLQNLPNSTSTDSHSPSTIFTRERFSKTSSRDTSFDNDYQPVQESDPSAGQKPDGYSPWDRFTSKIEQTLVDRWLIELSACGGSLLSLLALVIFLHHYDGRAQPDWPYNITINSVLSWFTTLMKALMLVSVTACLSQANRIQFSTTPHAFKDSLVYDSASRGPKGSLQLLWGFRARYVNRPLTALILLKLTIGIGYRYVASIGAVITILTLAVDPTVQQIVTIIRDQRNSAVPASLSGA